MDIPVITMSIISMIILVIGIRLALRNTPTIRDNTPDSIVIAICINKLLGAIYIIGSLIIFIIVNQRSF